VRGTRREKRREIRLSGKRRVREETGKCYGRKMEEGGRNKTGERF
jgi:hypothetical protein